MPQILTVKEACVFAINARLSVVNKMTVPKEKDASALCVCFHVSEILSVHPDKLVLEDFV